MSLRIFNRVRSALSEQAFVRAYERRQALRPTEGNRTVSTLLMTSFLAFLLFSAIVSLFWVQRSEISYLKQLSGVAIFPQDALTWTVRRAPERCDGPNHCTSAELTAAPPIYRGQSLAQFDYAGKKAAGVVGKDDLVVLSVDVQPGLWAMLAQSPGEIKGLVLALPALRFAAATAFVDGAYARRFFEGDLLGINIEPGPPRALHLDLAIRPQPAQPVIYDDSRNANVVFMAESPRYRQFTSFVAGKSSGQGKQLADIARIVLAIFSLLLFIFVDSSPECLALANFMAIKAIGVAFYQNWLPDWWASSEMNRDMRNFMFCFGDIMQLFFFLQLARVLRPSMRGWVIWGGTAALLYAAGIHGDFDALDVEWSEEIWRWRNVILGLACLTVAVAGARVCFKRRLYARAASMLVAASGTVVQIIYPLVKAYPPLFQTDVFQSLYFIWETHTPYVFALSAFINLSTLERRVKALSTELITTRETERQKALSESVSQAHLPIPALPSGLALAIHHDGSEELAKEACFVHWENGDRRLALVVHGFSGEGIAPALKGSACAALGTAVWQGAGASSPGERFAAYDRQVHDFMTRVYHGREAAPFVAGELDTDQKRLTLYRSDGTLPLIVERDGAGKPWRTRVVALLSRREEQVEVHGDAFLILTNATTRLGGRGLRDLVRYLDSRLEREAAELTAETLKEMVASYVAFLGRSRTMVALQLPRRAA